MSQIVPGPIASSNGTSVVSIALQPAGNNLGCTTVLPVTNLTPVAVKVLGSKPCGVITIVENSNNPVTDYYIMRPTANNNQGFRPAGSSYAFTAPFGTQWANNQIAGYIINVSAVAANFFQDENA